MEKRNSDGPLILVTGATGYVGGRLVPQLLALGYRVRCFVRDRFRLEGRPWHSSVEIAEGDICESAAVAAAMHGVTVAYYFVHSLRAGQDFHRRDLDAASIFAEAAESAGVERIIYLGGLGNSSDALSEHLRSRQQTGEKLRITSVPVTEFRAGVIVGSGSLSFEMIRYLTERIPLMICPKWVYTRTQPIGIRDVLSYLTAALSTPASIGRTFEIGGADVVSYGEMMLQYAEVRGLTRWMIPVPLLTPRLSSHWVSFMTPIPAVMAKPLIDGLRNENIVRDDSAQLIFPQIRPVGYRTAVERALEKLEAGNIETRWSDALVTSQRGEPVVLLSDEGMIREHRQLMVDAPPKDVFRVFSGLGGKRGWLFMNWAWRIRGAIDRLCGGVGLRRGRRDPDVLRIGDALDFWRVEAVKPNELVRLRAEMRVPGKAWLQFEVLPHGERQSILSQTAFFAPKGLGGWLYWYALYPVHQFMFSGMVNTIARRAAERHESPPKRGTSKPR